jgi:phosphoglycolate phosphatase
MNDQRFVLFDFDGVIVDTFDIAAALAKRVCVKNTPEHYRTYFEGNIYRESFGTLSEHDHGPDCDTTLNWWEEYQKGGAHDARPFPGVIDAVKAIAAHYPLAIISSGHGALFVIPTLERLGIASYFGEVLGAEVHTSKVEKMKMLFEKHALVASQCVFITDTLGDIREATEVKIGAIGVSWGWHSPETLEKGNPYRIAQHPADLPLIIDEYFAR